MGVNNCKWTYPVVAFHQWRWLWSGGQALNHGCDCFWYLGDVVALLLPAGKFNWQNLLGLQTREKLVSDRSRCQINGGCWMWLSGHCYLVMKVAHLIGEQAVFVCQEAEAPFLFQQSLFAAIGNKLLHVHLTCWDGLHILQTKCQRHWVITRLNSYIGQVMLELFLLF